MPCLRAWGFKSPLRHVFRTYHATSGVMALREVTWISIPAAVFSHFRFAYDGTVGTSSVTPVKPVAVPSQELS